MDTPVKMEQLGMMDSSDPADIDFDLEADSTPSPMPTEGTPGSSGQNPSSARRPPRKSTLTQQQKNQKRQRATQDQLVTLETEFNKNPTPTAATRERIASEINMTERSVQIWFQNRYDIHLDSLGSSALTLFIAVDELRSRCWPRRPWRMVRIVTIFQNP
jgi:hypothetical protein